MMRFLPILFVLALLLVPSAASAQTVAPIDKFQWSAAEPTLALAQGYRYEVEIDAAATPVTLAHTCTGTAAPFTCTANIPAVTPSTHVARVRAVATAGTGSPVIGPWSDPLTFQMSAVPSKPAGLTIIKG